MMGAVPDQVGRYAVWGCVISVVALSIGERQRAHAQSCAGEAVESAICQERQQEAFEMRARMELLLGRLETVRNPPWDAATLHDARTGYQKGNGLYDGKRFNETVRVYEKALESLA